MDGWTKVIAATVVALLGLAALNLSIWRRLRQASRERNRTPPAGSAGGTDGP